jgi:hypothetical protein
MGQDVRRSVASMSAPRVEVDFNKWGDSGGFGRVHLPQPEVERLRSDGFDVRSGVVVRAVDHDLDEEERPCWLEVDAEVGWDDVRGWYGVYDQSRMESVPKPLAGSPSRQAKSDRLRA